MLPGRAIIVKNCNLKINIHTYRQIYTYTYICTINWVTESNALVIMKEKNKCFNQDKVLN